MTYNVYGPADDAIRRMNRQNLKAFDRLRLMKKDEVNLITEVNKVYRESVKYARQIYYEVAFQAYITAAVIARMDNREATKNANRRISLDWVDDMLEEIDFVTLYRFDHEAERKAQRLAEALEATDKRNDEIDKALRYWTLQVGQYAINVTDRARMEAFRDAGVKRVRWNIEKDQRVCQTCHALDGKVFRIEDFPPKQHYSCRCFGTPVFD